MKDGNITRGQPLVALVAILGSWVGARALVWDAPLFDIEDQDKFVVQGQSGAALPVLVPPDQANDLHGVTTERPRIASESFRQAFGKDPASTAGIGQRLSPEPSGLPQVPFVAPHAMPVRTATAHQVMWMAALSRIPMPSAILDLAKPAPAPFYPAGREPDQARRWSADAWLMLRRGGASPAFAANAPSTYGASQAGAVVRYRLAPSSNHRPAAYLRTTAAIDGPREREVAAGLSARPISGVPVIAAVELRATDRRGGGEVRPAAMVVTELPPVMFGHGVIGEAYAQAGYVGGDDATAFVDGQMRVDGKLAGAKNFELRAGAAAWGGAQKGSGRLDVGPTANVRVGFGESGSARIGVDWRIRAAGDAAPSSGPALTISAGF